MYNNDYAKKVLEMRMAQNNYQRASTLGLISILKDAQLRKALLEKEVDELTQQIIHEHDSKQTQLF